VRGNVDGRMLKLSKVSSSGYSGSIVTVLMTLVWKISADDLWLLYM
jgi:hypothetical protein